MFSRRMSAEQREARKIRRRWQEAEQQQQEDRNRFRQQPILVEFPGRPSSVAHPKQAARELTEAELRHMLEKKEQEQQELDVLRRLGVRIPSGTSSSEAYSSLLESNLQQSQSLAQTVQNAKLQAAQDQQEVEREQGLLVSSPAPSAVLAQRQQQQQQQQQPASSTPSTSRISRRSSSSPSAAALANVPRVIPFDKDASHNAAMVAIDSALSSHDSVDRSDSRTRHHVAERLHRKSEQLKRIAEKERGRMERMQERAHQADRHARENTERAGELESRVSQILRDAAHERNLKQHRHSRASSSHSSSSSSAPTTAAERALVRDEKLEQGLELEMANEAVREESLVAHHKDISLAIQAKMAGLRGKIEKAARAVAADRAALANLASGSDAPAAAHLAASSSSRHSAAYDDTRRAKMLKKQASRLRQRAKSLREQMDKTKYSHDSLELAARCLETESHRLAHNQGLHSLHPQKLYSLALKTCGLEEN